ncbi:MAG: WYL domain-containing protein [Oscillospiraceae bacterium]|nr:WYL domain-containing protein [Oscillospiraceae bacterium]
MYANSPKKLLIMNILDILRKYTDEDHRLSQKDILDILHNEYQMDVDRKSIKRNLMNLIDFGYDIEYSESIRMVPNSRTGEMEENSILSDFYLVRDFTDSELRLLIDSLLFSKHIPYSQCRKLVEKLEGLSNTYFRSHVKHIRTMPDNALPNKQLFYTIEILDEAIYNGRQVSLIYGKYGTDKKLHPAAYENGKPKRQIINPYQMVTANGRYYLICNNDKYDNTANYRLDRIKEIKLLDTPSKSMKNVRGLENGLDLPKHMAEHIYMFTGESAPVRMRIKKNIINDVIDWFGRDVEFYDETEDEVSVRVKVNLNAMRLWALQYALHAKVLSPDSLVMQVREDIKSAAENYGV